MTCPQHQRNRTIPSTNPRPEPSVAITECINCGKDVRVSLQWWKCMNDGCEGKFWVEDFVEQLDINERRCEPCLEKSLKTQEKARYYQQSSPPVDFDPDYCGERWDNSY